MLDVPTEANLNKLMSASALKMIFSAPFEPSARAATKARISHWGSWLVERSELRRQVDLLEGALDDLNVRLQVISQRTRFNHLNNFGHCVGLRSTFVRSTWTLHRPKQSHLMIGTAY